MTNAELIKALRICANQTCCDNCPRYDIDHTQDAQRCCIQLINDAAAALEAAEKRIARLEEDLKTREAEREVMQDTIKICEEAADRYKAQMPKEGVLEAKKPKTVKETGYSFYCDCPTCGGRLISNVDGEWCAGSFDRFCRMCGQKIDWSEYCGCISEKEHGTCEHCGAPLKEMDE